MTAGDRMIIRFLRGALRLQPMRLGLIVISTAMGASILASFSVVSLRIKDQLAAELRAFGPNIAVEPEEAAAPAGTLPAPGYLDETDVQRALTIFWRNNIVGISPTLTAPVTVSGKNHAAEAPMVGLWFEKTVQRPGEKETIKAGALPLFPYWKLEGGWRGARGAPGLVLGRSLSRRLGLRIGDEAVISAADKKLPLKVTGIVSAGGFEEDEVFIELKDAQKLLGLDGSISNILMSVITVPLDSFGRKDPAGMSRLEFEKWYCTAYITSVANQLEKDIPASRARPLWSMAEAEARVLSRLNALMALLAAVALVAAMLAAAAAFTARIMGRRAEIALMRACGASAGQLVALLGAEAVMLGLAGGLAGAGLSTFLIRGLGTAVFEKAIEPTIIVLPIAVLGSLFVALAGAAIPLWRALSSDPATALKEA